MLNDFREMDAFAKRLTAVDMDALKAFLEGLTEPCYEATLLRIVFPDAAITGADPLMLFQNHFLLFNRLYALQEDYRARSKYLHIHFMRTFLFDVPPPGRCRFFEESLMRFCDAGCDGEGDFCPFHREKADQHALEVLSERWFYKDPANFHSLDADTAEKFMNGAWELLRHYDAVKQGFKTLDLPETATPEMIRRRFRQLAKDCHPDTGERDAGEFIRINNAYRLLMRLVPMF